MTTTTETWLDVIPAILLDRGVPVLQGGKIRAVVVDVFHGRVRTWTATNKPAHWEPQDAALHLRVDLDDPQGFGYALRLAFQESESRGAMLGITATLINNYLRNQTTDADRLALARALAEVSS